MRSAFWTRRRVQPVTRAVITARLLWQLPQRQLDFERGLIEELQAALDKHGRDVNKAISGIVTTGPRFGPPMSRPMSAGDRCR